MRAFALLPLLLLVGACERSRPIELQRIVLELPSHLDAREEGREALRAKVERLVTESKWVRMVEDPADANGTLTVSAYYQTVSPEEVRSKVRAVLRSDQDDHEYRAEADAGLALGSRDPFRVDLPGLPRRMAVDRISKGVACTANRSGD